MGGVPKFVLAQYGVAALVLGISVLVLLVRDHRLGARRKEEEESPARAPAKVTVRPSSCLWMLLLLGLGVTLTLARLDRQGRVFTIISLSLPVLLLAAFVALILWSYFANRSINKVFRRANAGDVDGAVREILAQIEQKGRTSERVNALGCLYMIQEKWQEALELFREAEAAGQQGPIEAEAADDRENPYRPPRGEPDAPGGNVAILKANQGLALWKLGRAEEAADVLAEAHDKLPDSLIPACNYCQVLTDLGRIDQAREQLARAEEIHRRVVYLSKTEKRQAAEQIDTCRKRLTEAAQTANPSASDVVAPAETRAPDSHPVDHVDAQQT